MNRRTGTTMSSILTIVPCTSITPAAALDVNTDPATAHHTCLIEPGPQDITLAGQYRVAMRAASAEATKNLRGMFPEQQDIFDRADSEPDSREELAFELFPHIEALDFTIEDATAFLDNEFLYREALPGFERLTSTSNTTGRYTKQEALDKTALVLERLDVEEPFNNPEHSDMLSTIIESVYSTPQWRDISGKMAKAYGSDAYLDCVDQLNTAEDADEQAAKKAAVKLADLDQQLKRAQEAKDEAEKKAQVAEEAKVAAEQEAARAKKDTEAAKSAQTESHSRLGAVIC